MPKLFFDRPEIRKLQRMENGSEMIVCYLKMILFAIDKNGHFDYTHLEDSFAEEIALDVDTDTDTASKTIEFMLRYGLIKSVGDDEYIITDAVEFTGSEAASTTRSRECRERQALQERCNATPLQQNATILQRRVRDRVRDREEIEIESEIESELESEKSKSQSKSQSKSTRFARPSLQDVTDYCNERNNNVDPSKFCDYYESNGWKVGKNPMKDWKAAVRTWEQNGYSKKQGGNKQFRTLSEMLSEEEKQNVEVIPFDVF